MSPPSSGPKNKPSMKPAWACLTHAFTLISCSAYSSTLKMEAICSSETSVEFQRITQRYIPEDSTLHHILCSVLMRVITSRSGFPLCGRACDFLVIFEPVCKYSLHIRETQKHIFWYSLSRLSGIRISTMRPAILTELSSLLPLSLSSRTKTTEFSLVSLGGKCSVNRRIPFTSF
jgi:hypothetical protein